MQRVIVNMQSFLMSEAVEQALKKDGEFHVIVVEKPQDLQSKCRVLAPTVLLMEVTGNSPWKLEERMEIRRAMKQIDPSCKVVLLVDEKADKNLALQIKQAKKDGLIDQFIYSSTSASFLSALIETL